MLEIKTDIMDSAAKILVVGVGGAGNNAVNRMVEEQIVGVEFLGVNTDKQALQLCKSPRLLQIGDKLRKVGLLGLGVVRIVQNGDVGRAKRLLFADACRGRIIAARDLDVRSRKNLKGLALDILGLGVVVRDLGELAEHGFRGLRVLCLGV